jgi:rhodanese-related sulfurtransferase
MVCGDNPTITSLESYDYDKFACQPTKAAPTLEPEFEIKWDDFLPILRKPDFDKENILLDVRPTHQYNCVYVKPSINHPWPDMSALTKEELESKYGLSEKKTVYISCRSGVASRNAAKKLLDFGYKNIKNVVGGIRVYMKEIDKYETVPNVI